MGSEVLTISNDSMKTFNNQAYANAIVNVANHEGSNTSLFPTQIMVNQLHLL